MTFKAKKPETKPESTSEISLTVEPKQITPKPSKSEQTPKNTDLEARAPNLTVPTIDRKSEATQKITSRSTQVNLSEYL